MRVRLHTTKVITTAPHFRYLSPEWIPRPRSRGKSRIPTITATSPIELVPLFIRLDIPPPLGNRPRAADRRTRIPPRLTTAPTTRDHRLTRYWPARRNTRHLRVQRIRLARRRSRILRTSRRRRRRQHAQLAERDHVSLLFSSPQLCDSQRNFVLFRDSRTAREQCGELGAPPDASPVDVLRRSECRRLLGAPCAHAPSEECEDADEYEHASKRHQ
jgi:hypothetical protein